MATSFFYLQAEKNVQNSKLLTGLEVYAGDNKKQVYVLNKPLGDSKYSYSYEGALLLLIPNHSMVFVNFADEEELFQEYIEDFIEDLGSISDKYRYKGVIGRPRSWRNMLIKEVSIGDVENDIPTFLSDSILPNAELKKKCELLISLLTGSINDIEKVKGEVPGNILDKIKQSAINE